MADIFALKKTKPVKFKREPEKEFKVVTNCSPVVQENFAHLNKTC